MSYLVDGSNLLGKLGADRHSADDKRALARRLASFARSKRTRVVCFFDGECPDAFGTGLGSVTVRFSSRDTADDLIVSEVERTSRGSRLHVVTSDAALASRVARRNVEVVDALTFARNLQSETEADAVDSTTEWENYFSNPKNRNV